VGEDAKRGVIVLLVMALIVAGVLFVSNPHFRCVVTGGKWVTVYDSFESFDSGGTVSQFCRY